MDPTLHRGLMAVHVAAGILALIAGALAVALRKAGDRHALAGNGFCAAMIVLGVTAAILEPFRKVPGSPVSGLLVCYFIATGWMAARRHDGKAGRFEQIACAVALIAGTVTIAGAIGGASTPVGRGPVFAFGGLCLIAGLLDLNVVIRGQLTARQRLSRHLWRMCFAFFIATGSFFLGQQKVMPAAVRGSPVLLLLAFAPFAVMAFWLARLRFAKALSSLKLRLAERSLVAAARLKARSEPAG